jgi:hypothetical protein
MNTIIKKIKKKEEYTSDTVKTITLTFKGEELIEDDVSKLDKKILYKLLSSKKQTELNNLDYSITNLKMTYGKFKRENDKKLEALEQDLKAKYECPICMEKQREFVCIPCGHCYCEDCCRNIILGDGNCYTCRNRVDFFQKMY